MPDHPRRRAPLHLAGRKDSAPAALLAHGPDPLSGEVQVGGAAPYNRRVTEPEAAGGAARGILAADTSPWAEHLQVEAWRRMSPAEKARLVTGMTQAVRELALAGLRQRHPGASERELFLRFAVLTLGTELACRVYPDARAFVRS